LYRRFQKETASKTTGKEQVGGKTAFFARLKEEPLFEQLEGRQKDQNGRELWLN